MFKIDADDSSDEEEIKEIVTNYDVKNQHAQFLLSKRPPYIQENDPQGYSFLAYALGIKRFYSSNVNTLYYAKKAALGETTLDVKNEILERWVSKTLCRTISMVFVLENQRDLTKDISDLFIEKYSDEINQLSESWVEKDLRSLIRQSYDKRILPTTKNRLESIHEKINEFIDAETEADNPFDSPPFFNIHYFDSAIRIYMNSFYKENGLIRQNDKFALAKEWPNVTSRDPVENLMINIARHYTGSQTISRVQIVHLKQVFFALLDKELSQENSIVEKVEEEKYRLRMNVTDQSVQASCIHFLFEKKNKEIYLPYSINRLKDELKREFNKYFQNTFIGELKDQKRKLNITLNRGVTQQQHTFVSRDADEFHAHIRISKCVQQRRIRQARDDEGHEKITAESFQTAWQFGDQKYLALETQDISTQGSRSDQVINLETYARIKDKLSKLKEDINKDLSNCPKLNDALIARWVRDIAIQGNPVATYQAPEGQAVISFGSIPKEYQQNLLKFLVNFSYLLLGCEVQRNPSSLIIHQIALDLIDAGEITWVQAISHEKYEKSFGGGDIPMTMGAYRKDDDKKANAHPVSCARALNVYYANFAIKPWHYNGEVSNENTTNSELVKREHLLLRRWFILKKLENNTIEEKIAAIEEAIATKWYPA